MIFTTTDNTIRATASEMIIPWIERTLSGAEEGASGLGEVSGAGVLWGAWVSGGGTVSGAAFLSAYSSISVMRK
jgi:hypothetical protein